MGATGKLMITIALGGKLLFLGMFVNQSAVANDFTAEKVMKEMDAVQRYAYVAGVVEGLAISRYMRDGKQKAGMECIYNWFYDDKKNVDVIYVAFGKFPGYPPGSIIDALTKRKCGE